MTNIIKINGEWLPEPDDELEIVPEKIKTEKETESGKTVVIVTRPTKLAISGNWTLSGSWAKKFRQYREADKVTVEIYYPDTLSLSGYTCQFEITREKQVSGARKQLVGIGGLYKMGISISEI